jgi:hypothetical protein
MIEMFAIFGAFWFWVLVAEFVVLVALTENERPFISIGVVIVGLVLLHYLGGVSVFSWCIANPWLLVAYIVGYSAVGVAWSIAKWWMFVRERRNRYIAKKAEWIGGLNSTIQRLRQDKGGPIKDMEDRQRQADILEKVLNIGRLTKDAMPYWQDYARGAYSIHKPEAGNYVDRIINWMMFWPFSAFWFLLDRPIRRLFTRLYDSISWLLRKIADTAYNGIDDEINKDDESQ